MGLFDDLFGKKIPKSAGAIAGGKQKQDGSHDHRTNKGNDRTPSQKTGDKKREKE